MQYTALSYNCKCMYDHYKMFIYMCRRFCGWHIYGLAIAVVMLSYVFILCVTLYLSFLLKYIWYVGLFIKNSVCDFFLPLPLIVFTLTVTTVVHCGHLCDICIHTSSTFEFVVSTRSIYMYFIFYVDTKLVY